MPHRIKYEESKTKCPKCDFVMLTNHINHPLCMDPACGHAEDKEEDKEVIED